MSFFARYGGTCAETGDRIDVGDIVRYVDGEISHVRCSVPSREVAAATTCTTCFIAPCVCES